MSTAEEPTAKRTAPVSSKVYTAAALAKLQHAPPNWSASAKSIVGAMNNKCNAMKREYELIDMMRAMETHE